MFVIAALVLDAALAVALLDSRSQARSELEENFTARAKIAAAAIDSTLQAAALTQGEQDRAALSSQRIADAQLARAASLVPARRRSSPTIAARGEAIPLEGRIAAIADVFDALTSDRAYRPRMQLRRAVAIMIEGLGTHFDPSLLDAFIASLDAVVAISERPAAALP